MADPIPENQHHKSSIIQAKLVMVKDRMLKWMMRMTRICTKTTPTSCARQPACLSFRMMVSQVPLQPRWCGLPTSLVFRLCSLNHTHFHQKMINHCSNKLCNSLTLVFSPRKDEQSRHKPPMFEEKKDSVFCFWYEGLAWTSELGSCKRGWSDMKPLRTFLISRKGLNSEQTYNQTFESFILL